MRRFVFELDLTAGYASLGRTLFGRKGATWLSVIRVEVGASLPNFGKEFLLERGSQVAYALRASGSPFCADHSLHHLDVVRAPESKVFIVFQESFLFATTVRRRRYAPVRCSRQPGIEHQSTDLESYSFRYTGSGQ